MKKIYLYYNGTLQGILFNALKTGIQKLQKVNKVLVINYLPDDRYLFEI